MSELYIGCPSTSLVAIYGATVAGLLVMVVVAVVIAAIVNHIRQGGTNTYYTVAKTMILQRNTSKRGGVQQ